MKRKRTPTEEIEIAIEEGEREAKKMDRVGDALHRLLRKRMNGKKIKRMAERHSRRSFGAQPHAAKGCG